MGGEPYDHTLLRYMIETGRAHLLGGHPPATRSTRFPPMDPRTVRRTNKRRRR